MEQERIDPLQRAINRGSQALEFINAPLVLDYVQRTFLCTVPLWQSLNPFSYHINEGFYKYYSGAEQEPTLNQWSGALLRYRSVQTRWVISW